jgi:hypothetical protein
VQVTVSYRFLNFLPRVFHILDVHACLLRISAFSSNGNKLQPPDKKYIGDSTCLIFTISAEPIHDHMPQINAKAVFLPERPRQGGEKVFIQIYSLAAPATHQVVVMPFFGVVIDGLLTQLALEYAPGLL